MTTSPRDRVVSTQTRLRAAEQAVLRHWEDGKGRELFADPGEEVRSGGGFALLGTLDRVFATEVDDGSHRGSARWWTGLVEDGRLRALGTSVAAFVAQSDAELSAMGPTRGRTPSQTRILLLAAYDDVTDAVIRRDLAFLRAAIGNLTSMVEPASAATRRLRR